MNIDKKIIMSPKHPTPFVLKYCLILLVVIFLFSLKSCSEMGLPTVITMSLALFVLIVLLFIMPIWVLASKRVQTLALVEAKEKFSDFVGKNVKYIDVGYSIDTNGTSGTGIAYDGDQIYIMDRGEAAKIDWSKVRSWEWRLEGHETVRSTNFRDKVDVASENMSNRTGAYINSGFFIDVADIEKPRWQFMSEDKNTMLKWMEIFQQIKEASLNKTN